MLLERASADPAGLAAAQAADENLLHTCDALHRACDRTMPFHTFNTSQTLPPKMTIHEARVRLRVTSAMRQQLPAPASPVQCDAC